MTRIPETPQRRPVRAGSPRFRSVWNGRSEPATPADSAQRAAGAGAAVSGAHVIVRRGAVAPVLPGRAAIGVLGAPRRERRPGTAR